MPSSTHPYALRLFAPVAIIGLAFASGASAAPPRAAATLEPGGRYTLTLNPDQAWLAAEISVAGGETAELGATKAEQVVDLSGNTTATGPLWVVVRAAVAEQAGVTWTFAVDPQLLPEPAPQFVERMAPRRRGKDGRWRE